MHDKLKLLVHRMMQHGHEVAMAIVVEGCKGQVIIVLLMIAGALIAFALQLYFNVEE